MMHKKNDCDDLKTIPKERTHPFPQNIRSPQKLLKKNPIYNRSNKNLTKETDSESPINKHARPAAAPSQFQSTRARSRSSAPSLSLSFLSSTARYFPLSSSHHFAPARMQIDLLLLHLTSSSVRSIESFSGHSLSRARLSRGVSNFRAIRGTPHMRTTLYTYISKLCLAAGDSVYL